MRPRPTYSRRRTRLQPTSPPSEDALLFDGPPADGPLADVAQPDGPRLDLAQPDTLPADSSPADTLAADGGTIVLDEDFDSGLSGWTFSGAGSAWGPEPGSGVGGSGAAGVRKTGANKPSYLERAINLSGYTTATFAYARRLVGLDGADDFAAEYFASGAWVPVEQLESWPASS